MSFRITGLSPEPFRALFGRSAEELGRLGVQRVVADRVPGFPDRIELRDAEPGESLLLLNHTHQPAMNPYHACHAIFVREGAEQRYDRIDAIPTALRSRVLSLRAFGHDHDMLDADLTDGCDAEAMIERMLADPAVSYIHVHYAKRGCFAARIDRIDASIASV